jgi:trypsin
MKVGVVLLVVLLGLASFPALGHGIRAPDRTKMKVDPRIVGGTGTSFSVYPFFVDLDGCGASLIWEDVALTAAHCNFELSTARVGPNQEVVEIVSGTIHPNYNRATDNFDVMVLKLASSVAGASTIALETSESQPGDGDALTVIGLGARKENGSESKGLREVTVNHIAVPECNSLYGGGITDAMLCAGVEGGGKDSCQVSKEPRQVFVLVFCFLSSSCYVMFDYIMDWDLLSIRVTVVVQSFKGINKWVLYRLETDVPDLGNRVSMLV